MHKFETYGKSDSKNIIIQPADEHDLSLMESETEEVKRLLQSEDFCILAYPVNDWNKELSPWEAPAVFGKEDFGSGADETLQNIISLLNIKEEPRVSLSASDSESIQNSTAKTASIESDSAHNENTGKRYFLVGYSLAGLFSLWASFQTDIFSGIVAASPSMWFPNFVSYTKEHKIKTNNVYLSFGKKEEKTKNPVMRTVGDCIRHEEEILTDKGINTILEWNEGNHFVDSDKRVAKGITWLLKK